MGKRMVRIDEHEFPICERCRKLMPKDYEWQECEKCIEGVFSET